MNKHCYYCYKCQQGFCSDNENEIHMIPDLKAKNTWVFECHTCFESMDKDILVIWVI